MHSGDKFNARVYGRRETPDKYLGQARNYIHDRSFPELLPINATLRQVLNLLTSQLLENLVQLA